ncbi:hypothetical protein Tco_0811840 [Tanacetum coccineum]
MRRSDWMYGGGLGHLSAAVYMWIYGWVHLCQRQYSGVEVSLEWYVYGGVFWEVDDEMSVLVCRIFGVGGGDSRGGLIG